MLLAVNNAGKVYTVVIARKTVMFSEGLNPNKLLIQLTSPIVKTSHRANVCLINIKFFRY